MNDKALCRHSGEEGSVGLGNADEIQLRGGAGPGTCVLVDTSTGGSLLISDGVTSLEYRLGGNDGPLALARAGG